MLWLCHGALPGVTILLGPDDGSWDVRGIGHITLKPCPGLLRDVTAIIPRVWKKRNGMKGRKEPLQGKIRMRAGERRRIGSRWDQKGTWETGMEEERRPMEETQLQLEQECCLLVLYRDSKLPPISHIIWPCFHLHNIMAVISLRLCCLICKNNWAGLDHYNLF